MNTTQLDGYVLYKHGWLIAEGPGKSGVHPISSARAEILWSEQWVISAK